MKNMLGMTEKLPEQYPPKNGKDVRSDIFQTEFRRNSANKMCDSPSAIAENVMCDIAYAMCDFAHAMCDFAYSMCDMVRIL